MKSSRLVFPILLAFLLSSRPAAATRSSDTAEFCCFRYSTKILPWSWVRSYELTRSSCSQQAVIFTTKRGKKVCVQLREKWAKKYISLLKAQKQQ
ncbi:C-C motif chemokine 26 isoform X2 [Octodon degus]|nr:C-C motif chemokine 26 isoform X2 [Octodon degus]